MNGAPKSESFSALLCKVVQASLSLFGVLNLLRDFVRAKVYLSWNMEDMGFAYFTGVPAKGRFRALRARRVCRQPANYSVSRRARRSSDIRMQLPPTTHEEPPLTDEEKGPPGYVWNDDFPGTLKPGSVEDNFPLEKVLASDVYDRMKYEELEIDEIQTHIFKPDEDLLQWLAENNRLLPRDVAEDEFETEAERQISGITEEDLDYGDDDEKTIQYYYKQGEGSAEGAGSDFGGFAEPSSDTTAGF